MRLIEMFGNTIDWNPVAANPDLTLFNLDRAANSGTINPKDKAAFSSFLNSHRSDFVRLYHGTSKKHEVLGSGLLPTSSKRRNSLQSQSGYVYLTYDPQTALSFARMGYAGQYKYDLVVYAVEVTIGRLLPDHDQLFNKRMYTDLEIGKSLADSLIYGRGARVKGKIEPHQVTIYGTYDRNGNPIEN